MDVAMEGDHLASILTAIVGSNFSEDMGYAEDPLTYGVGGMVNGSLQVNLTATSPPGPPGPKPTFRLPLLKQPMAMVVVMSVAYLVVFLLAVVNNSLVVTVIYRNPQMRNVTNYFLANLAVADIMVSFLVQPITLLSILFSDWMFGPFLCKAIPYLQAVVVSASVTTQAVVALERYFAIFYPQSYIIKPNYALTIIGVIWLIPVCIQVPWAVYYEEIIYKLNSGLVANVCLANFKPKTLEKGFFVGVVCVTCYLVPLCFLTVCYSLIGIKVWKRNVQGIRGSQTERNIQRSKIRIVRMLIVVAVFFALSWLPLYSIRLRTLFLTQKLSQSEKSLLNILTPISQLMGSANSCVNPFIYCYFSEQFRKSIFAILGIKSCSGNADDKAKEKKTFSTYVTTNNHAVNGKNAV